MVSNAGRILAGSESIRLHPRELQDVRANWNAWSSVIRAARSEITLGDIAQGQPWLQRNPGQPLYRMNGQPAPDPGRVLRTQGQRGGRGRGDQCTSGRAGQPAPRRYAAAGVLRSGRRSAGLGAGFVINFVASVAIVIVVLLIFMGLRSGLLIGLIWP